ncbi:34e30a62-b771-43ff-a9c4-9cf1063e1a2c-CDS [Sclerotinia trifoliorum]|uniref:RNA polymerase II subunit B1 CTD phosphatase RPAP2 homolog n=1 Tax=Sclerotinia trifoliorum TaxID=28548 RepID=A0A8H2ZTR2_9HELO|nr:34e30a62-b771-43ff-a9c4-9cf1063e1a2c-CDS [Sclerotinia trifoliorum]
MSTPQKPKSILKQTASYPATSNTPKTTHHPPIKTKAERDREVALYHARLIQERKEIELEILTSTEELIDFPLETAPYDASNPSPSDAQAFKEMLRPFQPSDYDALILERNLDSRCGYTLCANPRPRDNKGGQWRLLGMSGKAKDFRIAKKEDAEKWCSDTCARRALYIRVQLSECPAWERSGESSATKIDLLDEPKTEEDLVMDGIGNLDLNKQEAQENQRKSGNLALERGETGQESRHVTSFSIIEKEVKLGDVKPPTLDSNDLSERMGTLHLDLEGHTSTFKPGSRYGDLFGENDDDDDTEMDTDWKI